MRPQNKLFADALIRNDEEIALLVVRIVLTATVVVVGLFALCGGAL
jgi:hypothetical protein